MTTMFRRPVQLAAFTRKETVEIIRQPKLLLTLVLGPFLIMALFGLGYDDDPPAMRTELVAPEGSTLLQQVEEHAGDLGAGVELVGTGSDEAAARRRLLDGDVDLVVTFPENPIDTVLAGERATITVVHTRLDPIEKTAIDFAARLAVEQINGQILARVVGEGQSLAALVADALSSTPVASTEAGRIAEQLASVDPQVLVRPFASEVELAVPNVDGVADWYAPAAVMLMLQQFGVAFGALTFVRERQLGIVDVFRVAPVNATEALVGKYLAFLLVGGAIGAGLTALVVVGLGVPVAGSIANLAIAMGLTLIASIGLGLVISLASPNDAQAVQWTMITLLASLFFSGFFLSIGQLEGAARVAGWFLPVTYGMQLLRDVMLRGIDLDPALVGGLVIFAVVTFALALVGARRRMSTAA